MHATSASGKRRRRGGKQPGEIVHLVELGQVFRVSHRFRFFSFPFPLLSFMFWRWVFF